MLLQVCQKSAKNEEWVIRKSISELGDKKDRSEFTAEYEDKILKKTMQKIKKK